MSGRARLDRLGRLSEGNGHPLVKELVRLLNDERCGVVEMCERAGVDRKTFYDWRIDTMPAVDKLDACGNVLGYRLAWVPVMEGPSRAEQAAAIELRRQLQRVVTQRHHAQMRGAIVAVDGRKLKIRWADGIVSIEDAANVVDAAFDHARDCPHCGKLDCQIRLHGHVQCKHCAGIIQSCCGD